MPTNDSPLRSFAKDECGASAVIVALTLTVVLTFVAFSIDLGMAYGDRAHLQADTDLIALGTAADLDAADGRLAQMLEGNGLTADALSSVQYGRYLRNPAIAHEQRFQPLDQGAPGVNAVALTLIGEAPLTFGRILAEGDSLRINGAATATRTGAASFSLGSRLFGLDPAALSDALSQNLGTQITLSARDVEVLAAADINTADLLDALAARVEYAPLNPADVLTLRPRLSDLIFAMQSVLPAEASSRLSALTTISGFIDLEVSGLIAANDRDLGLTLTGFLEDVRVSALDVLLAAADGVDATASLPVAMDTAVPGVLSTSAQLRFQERPADSGWVAIGEVGTTLHSAAARLSADIELAPSLLGNLGIGISATGLSLPIHAELAGATATLTDLSCAPTDAMNLTDPTDPAAVFSTSFRPLSPSDGVSVATLYLGEMDPVAWASGDAISPDNLGFADFLDVSINLGLIRIDRTLQIRSLTTVGQSQTEEVAFTFADAASADPVTRRFGAGDLLGTAVSSLLAPETTEIRLKPGQGGGAVGALLALLPERLLTTLVGPLDTVLDTALSTAGLAVGEGELTLTGHHCETVQLVR